MKKPIEGRDNQDVVQRVETVAFVDGDLPVPCEIGRRRPVNFGQVADAELSLLMARYLHASGDHRQSFMWAIRASREMFEAVGGDRELQEPLRHLFYALDDLDRGTQDQALLAETVANRSGKSAAEWDARACLAGALEARVKQRQKEKDAAEAICKKFSVIASAGGTNRRQAAGLLIEWRKQFRSGKKKPPAGNVTWNAALHLIGDILKRPEEWQRFEGFMHFEKRILEMAETYRGRVAPSADSKRGE